MLAKSKNESCAKAELQKKYELLEKGKVPRDTREVIKREKKFTANEAFIKNKQLKQEYENRSYASHASQQL